MEIRLPADLNDQVAAELASGRYRNSEQLIEEAVRKFFEERRRSELRVDALRRLGQAVDEAGLYNRTYIPSE